MVNEICLDLDSPHESFCHTIDLRHAGPMRIVGGNFYAKQKRKLRENGILPMPYNMTNDFDRYDTLLKTCLLLSFNVELAAGRLRGPWEVIRIWAAGFTCLCNTCHALIRIYSHWLAMRHAGGRSNHGQSPRTALIVVGSVDPYHMFLDLKIILATKMFLCRAMVNWHSTTRRQWRPCFFKK